VMVQVFGEGRGIMKGEGLGMGAGGIRWGPWVVVVYIFKKCRSGDGRKGV